MTRDREIGRDARARALSRPRRRRTSRRAMPPRQATVCAQGAERAFEVPRTTPRDVTRSVVPPMYPSTTYARDENHELPAPSGRALCYARPDNPSVRACEETLRALERGEDCAMFSSGMAAVTAVLEGTLGDSDGTRTAALAPRRGYFAVRQKINEYCASRGIEVVTYDPSSYACDVGDEVVSSADARRREEGTSLSRTARAFAERFPSTVFGLIWIEPTANPTWDITDIGEAMQIVQEQRGVGCVCVDATVLTPICCQPLVQFGCHIVMHSATKYLNGHSDVVAGALITKECDATWEKILHHRKMSGPTMGSFDAYLLSRGMRTLDVRVRRQSKSAMYIAERLQELFDEWNGPRTTLRGIVLYPGLRRGEAVGGCSSESTYDAHAELLCPNGVYGGMLSIVLYIINPNASDSSRVLKTAELARLFASKTRHWTCATSLGGYESLIEHRYSVECKPGEVHPHIPPGLLRLSVGLEDERDLFDGLQQSWTHVVASN